MDPLTHGLAGAAASLSIFDEKKSKVVAFTGAVSAMMADLDFFIQNPADPLFNIEIHRQFTHSILFIPVGALVASALLWCLFRKQLTFKELYLYSIAGYATAGILDSFTSYGTQLLWPFFDERFAWNLISVVDPIVTIGLIFFIGLSVWKQNKKWARAGSIWILLILLFGFFQQIRAVNSVKNLADQRGHTIEEVVVKPTIANQRLWRANYIYDGRVYADGIRTGIISGIKIYEGDSAPRVIIEEEFSQFQGTTLYNDLLRFKHLSNNFLIRHPENPTVIGDARYSMLPTSIVPLWGVEADTTYPGAHLPFLYFRDASEEIREPFWDMLMGN